MMKFQKIWDVLKKGWPTAIPLAVLIYVLFSGYSPHMAAFWGITSALAVGLVNPMNRITISDISDGCVTGVKYALSVGAVCRDWNCGRSSKHHRPGLPARLYGNRGRN